MGLRNFSSAMPKEMRQAILEQLRKAFRAEKDKLPDAVTRTLIAWGDADYVHEALGETLRGHPMEIEVSLVDRSGFAFPVLLGRTALKGLAVVDSELEYTADPTCPAEEDLP